MSSRARSKLNVKQVSSLTKPGVYSDGGGLYLRIRESGRSWFFIGTLNGKRIEIGLGSALDVTLAKARDKAEIARQACLAGVDPRGALRPQASEALATETFGSVAMGYIAAIEGTFRNNKHARQWSATLRTYAASMFDIPIDEIDTDHVLAVLQPIWTTKPETASRVRGRIERVLDAAKARGLRTGENPARWRGHLDIFLVKRSKRDVRHHPALPFKEMAGFMGILRIRTAVAARALEFAILTAARSGEVRGMTWGEIDLNARIWRVPADRMKAGVAHEVPLSGLALDVLSSVATDNDRPGDLVFVAPRGGQFSDMALLQLLRRLGRPDITVHGFRSSFRDWAGEVTQFGREEVEMSLAHTFSSETERAYRRGRALEKRRDLMEAWAKFCTASTN